MTLPYRIREAVLADNDRLIALAKRCVIQGQLHLAMDRYPDFFAMPRMQGERSFIYVAESSEGDIVACAAMIERTEIWEGETIKVLHFGDLRTDPALRRTHVAGKLIEIYREKLLNEGYHHGITEIIDGNTAPIKAQRLLGKDIEVCYEGGINMYQLLPLWNYRPSKKWTYRQASAKDLPQVSALLRAHYKGVPGAPSFTREWIEKATQQHGSFNISHLWIAEDPSGKIAACVGVWDQSAIRRTVAMQFSKSVKFIVRALAVLGLLWRLPPIPKEGKALSYQCLRWPATRDQGETEALRSLIRFLMRKVRAEGKQQFVSVAFHQNDKLTDALTGLLKVKELMHLYSHKVKSVQKSLPAKVGVHSHYIDLGLI